MKFMTSSETKNTIFHPPPGDNTERGLGLGVGVENRWQSWKPHETRTTHAIRKKSVEILERVINKLLIKLVKGIIKLVKTNAVI